MTEVKNPAVVDRSGEAFPVWKGPHPHNLVHSRSEDDYVQVQRPRPSASYTTAASGTFEQSFFATTAHPAS